MNHPPRAPLHVSTLPSPSHDTYVEKLVQEIRATGGKAHDVACSPPDDFDSRDTLPTMPPASSLIPPPVPSDLGPYEVPHIEVALGTIGFMGVASLVYLGAELAHHWQLGGWVGVAWFVSIVVAAMLAGGTVGCMLAVRLVRRGR